MNNTTHPKALPRLKKNSAPAFEQAPANLARRFFVLSSALAGGGLMLGFNLPSGAQAATGGDAADAGVEIDAWVAVRPDDTCVIRFARTEMGQGTRTGLAQLIAEELDCDWDKVTTEMVSPQANLARKGVWGQMLTVGSFGIRFSHDKVRRGGAAARAMLLQAAANEWGVAVAELSVQKGLIRHAASGRQTSYGKVALAASRLPAPDPKTLQLKAPADWKIAGQPLKRLDTAPKLNGSKIYAVDLAMPGMLTATIKACPVFGGSLLRLDDAAALKSPGVRKVVRVGTDAYAVIADTWWQAKSALEKVRAEWDYGPHAAESDATIAARLSEGLETKTGLFEFRKEGDSAAIVNSSAKKVAAVYSAPFLAHATMEPMNCTARVGKDAAEIWVPTQDPEGAHLAMSKQSGLPLEKCTVHRFDPGGGFGRRGRVSDFVTQAVAIAQQMPGTAIKLIWSREEDMTHGQYRPISKCKLSAGFDAENRLTAVHVRLSGQSIYAWRNPTENLAGFKDNSQVQGWFAQPSDQALCYAFPQLSIEYAMRNTHVPVGTWRGVNIPQNAFYMECFVEELARAAGTDSVAFRKQWMTKDARQSAILDLAAEKGDWGKPLPPGVYRGIAQYFSYATYCAATAEVSLNAQGEVKVHRIVLALDCGYAVNPGQIEAQVEGSVVYGLSAALWGECSVQQGRVVETNFHDYRVLRMAEMPKVETHIRANGAAVWGGIGEPTIAVVAPAVANALSLALGKPVRSLPIKIAKLA